MSLNYLFLLATLPILLAGVLLIGFRLSAKVVMPAAFLLTVFIGFTGWGLSMVHIMASVLQGLVITFDILYIIFAAILLLNILKHSGGFLAIRKSFTSVSPDRRVQVVIIAWLFGSFIEGAAGFGTPAAVVGPLLVALGFPAMAAVMLGMMVQSTAVTTGSVGTPILIGIRGGLQSTEIDKKLDVLGIGMDNYIQVITDQIVVFHAIAGFLMPTIMVVMMTRFFGKNRSWREGFEIWPFTLIGGLAFTIPYMLTGWFLGPEFPSLLGSVVGLMIMIWMARKNILTPKTVWDFDLEKSWPHHWLGNLKPSEVIPISRASISVAKVWYPYLFLGVLLVLSRLPQLPFKEMLMNASITFPNILGTGLTASTAPLYLPGTFLLITAGLSIWIFKTPSPNLREAVSESGKMILGAGFVLIFTVPMVRVYINSGVNPNDLPAMPIAMAEWIALHVGSVYPLLTPSVGALGAFIAGSNTVSNLMFSLFQFGVAERLLMPSTLILALQAVGAAAGNMVAIHNVVAASATVGLLGSEGLILRKTILPTIYYLLVTGLLGLLVVYWIDIKGISVI